MVMVGIGRFLAQIICVLGFRTEGRIYDTGFSLSELNFPEKVADIGLMHRVGMMSHGLNRRFIVLISKRVVLFSNWDIFS
jgi:hypothetical protein